MKRYNQGFLKFGPMEQCDTGEWARVEDCYDLINHEREDYYFGYSELAKEMYQENSALLFKLKVVTAGLIVSFVTNAMLIAVM